MQESREESILGEGWTVWKGKWISNQYPKIYGNIFVPLKDDDTEKYKTTAVITYDGVYMTGARVKLPIDVSSPVEGPLKFNGIIGDQTVEYSISEYTLKKITGTYKTTNPNDKGTISLDPSDKQSVDYTEQAGLDCVIF